MHKILVGGLLALALGARAQAEAPGAPVEAVLQAYAAAWAKADANALAKAYAPDGELQTPYGVGAKGPAAIRRFYATAFQHGYAGSKGEAKLDQVQPIAPDALLGRGHWRISGAHDSAGRPREPEGGLFFVALRREAAGEWKIVVLHELGGARSAS